MCSCTPPCYPGFRRRLTGEDYGTLTLTDEKLLEFPAGTVDPGEDSLTAARRELLEETGYEAGDWSCIGTVSPNPAFMTNTIRTYLKATGRI